MTSKTTIIRDLNDRYRKDDHTVPGRTMITIGVQELVASNAGQSLEDIINEVANFDAFTNDNDPRGEHDFGAFDFLNTRLFWKIDYYDNDVRYGSEDPGDPSKTIRVLTIMLVNEY